MKIVYTKPDGSIAIVHPVSKEKIHIFNLNTTEQEYMDHLFERSIPKDATNIKVIDDSVIPSDRTFRNAWVHKDGVISHDLKKATNIALEKVRFDRKSKFESLDIEYMKAHEINDSIAIKNIVDKKQMLRDCTNKLKSLNAISIEDIKNSIPDLSNF